MTRTFGRASALLIVFGIVLASLGGCWNPFAPSGGGNGHEHPPATYRDRTSSENVLHNLTTAYEYMNATEYLDCLAEEFLFHPSEADQGNPDNPLPETWGKMTEQDIHENMFGEGSDVDRITLTLTEMSSAFSAGASPDSTYDDTWEFQEGVDLRVFIPIPGDELILLATADQLFVFQVDPHEVGAQGQDLWEVIDWWDLQEDQPGRALRPGPGVEAVSFGRLKSMYAE